MSWPTGFDGPAAERAAQANYGDVVLEGRLRSAIERLNPDLPEQAVEKVLRRVVRTDSPSLIENNRTFHRLLTDVVDVSWMAPEGEKHAKAWLVDPADATANDWLAVNQFTVVENKHTRRPDIVLFVNGLPLAVVELKNAADEKATLRHAYNQLQTYKEQIPALFAFNELLVISDGMEARMRRVGSLYALAHYRRHRPLPGAGQRAPERRRSTSPAAGARPPWTRKRRWPSCKRSSRWCATCCTASTTTPFWTRLSSSG